MASHSPYAEITTVSGQKCVTLHSPVHGDVTAVIVRARRSSIAIKPAANVTPLEIAIPSAWTSEQLVHFIQTKKDTFESYINKILTSFTQATTNTIELPTTITLATGSEPLTVMYRPDATAEEQWADKQKIKNHITDALVMNDHMASLYATPNTVLLWSAPDKRHELALLLRIYIRRLADRLLPKYVLGHIDLAMKPLSDIAVTDASGRWGSLSRKNGTQIYHLHLNWRAILLEPALLRHLLCHELTHMQAMNHGTQFRTALAKISPRWEELEKALDNAWLTLPLWTRGKTPKR